MARRHHLFRQRGSDKSPGTDLTLKVPFSQQLSVRVQNWKTGHGDIGSQFPAGGYLLPGEQISAQDCLSVTVIHLAMERLGFVAIDHKYRAESGSYVTHQP
ncbi:MAG TPA: hypothetical protein VGJ21_02040 [Terracidiphilus sp.]